MLNFYNNLLVYKKNKLILSRLHCTGFSLSNAYISYDNHFNRGFGFSELGNNKFYSSVKNKNRFKIWLSHEIFVNQDFDKFRKEIFYSGKLKPNFFYSVILKVRKGDIFLTAGAKQQKVKIESFNDYDSFREFYDEIVNRLELLFEEYENELDYFCDAILLEFYPVEIIENLRLIPKEISNLQNVKEGMSKKTLSITKNGWNFFGDLNMDNKGLPIDSKIEEGKLVLSGLDNKPEMYKFLINFQEELNSNNKNYLINAHSKFYLIQHQNKYFVIITDKVTNDITIKRCFSRTGSLMSKISDVTLPSGNWRRYNNNLITTFSYNNKIIMNERKTTFRSIRNDIKSKPESGIPNSNIGVIDLETFESDSLGYCYAIGFFSSVDQQCKTFYIDKTLDSSTLIHTCISELLRDKYKDITFYTHNFGRFDGPFIIKGLSLFNQTEEGKENPYTFESVTRNSDILRLTIKRKIDNKIRKIKIQDSVAILPRRLRDLCKDFGVKTTKSYFPYIFCNKNTLFYEGQTPSINYYTDLIDDSEVINNNPEEISKLKLDRYKSIYKDNWSLRKECLCYLEKDLRSLYEVLVEVNKTIYLLFRIQMTECLTVSGIAMKIFFNRHYDSNNHPIPLITNKIIFDDIHKAYYGGRVEVYNPIISDKDSIVYYYDVNSLYPKASLNIMPGLQCSYIETLNTKIDLNNLFGFFYCKINYTGKYLGLLPYRHNDTKTLVFPIGEWEGWYFSEEIKFASEHGYKIEVIKGYKFNKSFNVFNNFVNEIYEIKSNPNNPSEKNVAKLILNSLIGRFGMDFLKVITKLVDSKTHNLISTTRVLKNTIEIDDNLYIDSFKPGIDKDVCKNFNLDFIKVLNAENFDEGKSIMSHTSVSITTAAAVLSYARIHMAKLLLYILNNGGKLYYTDTDSIITNLQLPEYMVDPKELGKLKLEHKLIKGYFIADKTYAFKTLEGKIIKRAKGIDSSRLDFQDYIKMYNMQSIDYATKISSYRNYSLGSVTIKRQENVKLNPQYYNKRRRVFKTNPWRWVGTKPVKLIKVNYK